MSRRIRGKKDVAVYLPYELPANPDRYLSGEKYIRAGDIISHALQSNMHSFFGVTSSLEQMKKMDEYGVVLILSHGMLIPFDVVDENGEFTSEISEIPYFGTSTSFNSYRFATDPEYAAEHIEYSADYASYRVVGSGDVAMIGPAFFEHYYEDGSLSESFWFLASCLVLKDTFLSDVLIGKGVSAVAGFSNIVFTDYAEKCLFETVINGMLLSADTFSGSLLETLRLYGRDHKNNYNTIIRSEGDPDYRIVNSAELKPQQLEPIYEYEPDPEADSGLYFKLYTDPDGSEKYMVFGRPGTIHAAIPSTYDGKPVDKIAGGGFSGCKYLKSVSIPSTITVLPKDAFANCEYLEQITLPSGLTEIGEFALWDCRSLTSITVPETVSSIGSGAFGLTSIETFELNNPHHFDELGNIFDGCVRLKSVHLNASVSKLSGTFHDCCSLREIGFPENLKTIGQYTFYGCSSLRELDLPEGVETLEAYAIHRCDGILSLNMPDSVKEIGQDAASECKNLNNLLLPKKIQEIGMYAFRNCPKFQRVRMPEEVYAIGEGAFQNCPRLRTNLPDNVTEIRARAFKG